MKNEDSGQVNSQGTKMKMKLNILAGWEKMNEKNDKKKIELGDEK